MGYSTGQASPTRLLPVALSRIVLQFEIHVRGMGENDSLSLYPWSIRCNYTPPSFASFPDPHPLRRALRWSFRQLPRVHLYREVP
jgi:hypothetical protein